uniref:Uncharacterized protein n=1 Tax=Ralstonia syzygii R24 TaxID=907261 RepID=G3ACA0_9RALS|nr:hypothetical protein RALSY_mp30503 [Ralstonia syzygii R24]
MPRWGKSLFPIGSSTNITIAIKRIPTRYSCNRLIHPSIQSDRIGFVVYRYTLDPLRRAA